MRHSKNFNWYNTYVEFGEKLLKYQHIINKYKSNPTPTDIEKNYLILLTKELFVFSILLIKSYLRYNGMFFNNDHEIIKVGFYTEIIKKGQDWVDLLFEIRETEKILKSSDKDNTLENILSKYYDCFIELDEFMEKKYETIWH